MSVSDQIIKKKKYLTNSPNYMSEYGKRHILNLDYNNIYSASNSGTFENLDFLIDYKFFDASLRSTYKNVSVR